MSVQLEPLQRAAQAALQDVTPTRLKLLLVLNGLLALIFCIAAVSTVEQHEHAVRTVGIDAAPSVIAAHEIKIGFEAMDQAVATQLLYQPGGDDGREAAEDFRKNRQNVAKQLVAAAKNITYGSAEQTPIENIQDSFGDYLMQVQAACDLHKAGKDAEAISAYRAVVKLLQTQLLPAIDSLDKANADVLETIYGREKAATNLCRGFVLVSGVALLALLLYTQIYLFTRFRRRLNVAMLLATIAVALFLHQLTSALGENSRWLRIAKEDAYNSIFALLDARADAYAASSAEIRWLLDKEQRAQYEQQFNQAVNRVASFDPDHNFAETLEHAQQQLTLHHFNLPGFRGSLADELNNLRFPGESEAAVETLRWFSEYYACHLTFEKLESSGQHAEAVRVCMGYKPTESRNGFDRFDDALNRTLQINQEHMKEAIDEALRDLVGLILGASVISSFAAVCVALAVLPRIDEYVRCAPKHVD